MFYGGRAHVPSAARGQLARALHARGGLSVLLALAIFAGAGCGGDAAPEELPSGALVRVGPSVITISTADSFLPRSMPPAERRRARERLAPFLIQGEWVRRQARAHGVTVSAAELRATRVDLRTENVEAAMRASVLYTKLVERLLSRQPPLDDGDARTFYREHPRHFSSSEVRQVRLVAADSRRDAARALRSLRQGAGWTVAIERYSSSKHGLNPSSGRAGVIPEAWPAPLDRAVFGARLKRLVGPVRVKSTWYVLKVTKVVPPVLAPFSSARAEALSILGEKRTARTKERLVTQLRARYRGKTTCADDLELPECANGSQRKIDAVL